MPAFYAIAALSENRVIGNRGKIPWHLPEDFRWFKHKTMGGTLIMGRKTFESIGKPLPGRKTVVITRNTAPFDVSNCCTLSSLDAALATLPAPYWVCGGAEIYRQLLPKCDILYLTRIKRFVEGDVLLPDFENDFTLSQTIHENSQFRVERWHSKKLSSSESQPEPWPFA